MLKLEKISYVQLITLILINRFLFGFSFMPTVTISPANQDSWIADILSGVIIIVYTIPLLIMASKFPQKSFDEYFEIILGKPIGKFINLMYALYLLFITLLSVALLLDFLLTAVYPETPLYVIVLFMLVPCLYASYKGLECLARSSVISYIIVFLIMLFYVIVNYNNMDFKVFLPVMSDSTPFQIAYGAFNQSSRFCDCFLFFLFVPCIINKKKHSVTKILIIIVIIFTLSSVFLTLATQAVLGPQLSKKLIYPYFISIQQINIFDIIQRIEFFNIIAWIIIFFSKISSTVLAASIILARVFKVKSYKPFLVPSNILIFLSVVLTSISYYSVFKEIVYEYAYLVIFTANFIIPFLVMIVFIFRRISLSKKYDL